ncbi:MAG: DEAD/DEAH box helicase family protein [Planctomycetota bacterium]
MNRTVNAVSNRLSLRLPQRRSLEILHQVMESADPREQRDAGGVLAAIQQEFSSVEDFERSFPSICFALATATGKTRLMGAFIAYLHLEHGVRNFFVLAPNLTIYEKLLGDFSPVSPKYVFQGIAEFAIKSPMLVTGDNFEERPQVMHLFEKDDVVVNLFNIAKFGVRSKDARKAWRLSEYLGQSYFDHLAEQDDLVLLMDESHRYRGEAAMQAIADLRPMLALELTATPQVESSGGPVRFRNIIYEYPLAQAMRDGLVKDPAVATRRNFNSANMSREQLDRLKLEDGIRIHEDAKVALDLFARERGSRPVKPFMLVIASDTEHANRLLAEIEGESFFDGRYRGRVIQVHSGQRGAEKDENVARLLAVEKADEPTEIVIHVNMLKEGWDVTNLFTIVPLRAADSRTLVEQAIGRGLRLPYGKRTGVPAVDRLTIVAHDRFQDIVDEARKGGYSFSVIHVGEDVAEGPKQSVVVPPVFETILTGARTTGRDDAALALETRQPEEAPKPRFESPEDAAAAHYAIEAIRKATRDARVVPGARDLETPEVQEKLATQVTKDLSFGEPTLFPKIDPDRLTSIVREATEVYLRHTIAIPRVIVLPQGEVRAGFNKFRLDLSSVRLQPVPAEILIQHLTSDEQHILGEQGAGHAQEQRLEDYLVRALIDFDDINYDEQAEVLYDLAGQVVTHLRSYLADDEAVRNVLRFHQKSLGALVHGQMQEHAWEKATSYEVTVSAGFTEVRQQAFAASADERVRPFNVPVDKKSDIRRMLFGGFKKCIYPTQKFDVDAERRFAVILERDALKWFKPGRNVFQIRYAADSDYEPDFAVETSAEKLLCETKRADQLQDETVLAKARAAAKWCRHAAEHELKHGGKPWRYVLIPHDAVQENMTLEGLVKAHEFGEGGR